MNDVDVHHGRHKRFCKKCRGLLQWEQSGTSGFYDCPKCQVSLLEDETVVDDAVKNPSHYIASNGLQVRTVIESFELGFNLGNVIKYTLRAGKKGNKVQDLQKAVEYLTFEIEKEQAK